MYLVFVLATLLTSTARAENNGLAFDAQNRGYSIEITDVVVGKGGQTLGRDGVRVVVSHPLKNGSAIVVKDPEDRNRDPRIQEQVTELCVAIFGTDDRLQQFSIEGVGYAYGRAFDQIQCLFAKRER